MFVAAGVRRTGGSWSVLSVPLGCRALYCSSRFSCLRTVGMPRILLASSGMQSPCCIYCAMSICDMILASASLSRRQAYSHTDSKLRCGLHGSVTSVCVSQSEGLSAPSGAFVDVVFIMIWSFCPCLGKYMVIACKRKRVGEKTMSYRHRLIGSSTIVCLRQTSTIGEIQSW